MLVAIIMFTRAVVAMQVEAVLTYRPTGQTCTRKNGRKRKLKYPFNHRPKRPRAKSSTVDCAWTRIKTPGMSSYLYNQKCNLGRQMIYDSCLINPDFSLCFEFFP